MGPYRGDHLVSLAEDGREDYGREPWMDDREHAALVAENTGTPEERADAIMDRAVEAGYPDTRVTAGPQAAA